MSRWQQFDILDYGPNGRLSIPARPGVYVIYFDGRPVYVGQSANLRARVSGHRIRHGYGKTIHTPWEELPHTAAVTVKVKCSRRIGDWAMWEIRLIARLRPEFNVHHQCRRVA